MFNEATFEEPCADGSDVRSGGVYSQYSAAESCASFVVVMSRDVTDEDKEVGREHRPDDPFLAKFRLCLDPCLGTFAEKCCDGAGC